MEKLLTSIIIFSFFLFSPPKSFEATSTEVLESFDKKFESIEDLKGVLIYNIGRYSNKTNGTEGGFLFKKGNKFCLNTERQKIICDGEVQWVYLHGDSELIKSEYDPEENFNMEALFSLYKSGSNIQYKGLEKVFEQCHKIVMDFEEGGKKYSKSIMWINAKTFLPEKIIVIDQMQIMTSYKFKGLMINQGYSDSDFMFDETQDGSFEEMFEKMI